AKRPRWSRNLLWEETDTFGPPSYTTSLYDPPFPPAPNENYLPAPLVATVRSRPDLFKVVTPIKVDVFEELLKDHPNQPLVQSVCRGLREGFWPWATIPSDYPVTYDAAQDPFSDPDHAQFYRDKIAEERSLGRISEPFGTDLLPGMYNMPVFIISQSGKYRMVDDHSATKFSLNSMIPKDERHMRLDGIQKLGVYLR
ncbi:hypothetical protein BD410DRAFT_707375, partial [Rickenella mellea]